MLQQGEAGAHTCSRMHHLGEAGEALVREGFPIPSHFATGARTQRSFFDFLKGRAHRHLPLLNGWSSWPSQPFNKKA